MKKIILFGVMISITFNSFSQDDDIPDYRSTKDNFKKILQKDLRADISSFALAGIDESLNKESLSQLPATKIENNFIEFTQDGFLVKILAGKFEKEKHKLTNYNEKYLVKIDNKAFWGTPNNIPEKTIALVLVVIGKDTVNIPVTAFNDLFEPTFSYYDKATSTQKTHNAVYLSKDGNTMYVYMINSDSKSMYEVTWVIQNKTYIRRVVDWGFQN